MTIFAIFFILIMLLIGGTGVDLMRNEMERTRLQAVADRAVLAAADLDQTLDPEAVVRDYFTKAGLGSFVSSVVVDPGLNYRTVSVNALAPMNTQFMKNFGVPILNVPARSTAEERINKVEISLVLDISGSMNKNSKMANLKAAAGTFIDAVLTPANKDLISVSLVPYSEQVNAGPKIFNRMNTYKDHNYSHCVEFYNSEFSSTTLSPTRTFSQMQHFQWNYYSIETGNQLNTLYDTVCPRKGYERIIPHTQNASYLKRQINKLKPRAGTQIFLGMKWATALLDPTFRPISSSLASASKLDPAFAARPVDYSDTDTLKTIILMTDGQNSRGSRIANSYYNSDSDIAHWNSYNLNYYLNYYVNWSNRSNYYWTKYSESTGDALLSNMCTAAKAKHIVIWTIGFEVENHGANVMKSCASSPSHFFRVEGVNITDAFDAIARQINQLRLTQ